MNTMTDKTIAFRRNFAITFHDIIIDNQIARLTIAPFYTAAVRLPYQECLVTICMHLVREDTEVDVHIMSTLQHMTRHAGRFETDN